MIECARCGNKVNFYMQEKGSQTGLYCKECMRWQKWVGKKDIKGYQMRGIPMVAEGVAVIPQQPELHEGDVGVEVEGSKEVVQERVLESVAEVEKLKEEIKKQKEEIRELNGIIKEREQEEESSDGCGVCKGLESLEAIQTEVDISIYSGVLTVTSENGEDVKGVYPVKYCINCGKKFE